MSVDNQTAAAKKQGWRGQLVQFAAILLAVFVAKGALAEPFYVPSGSMEPTLLIGDALLASKYPYGYGTASLPIQINLPETGRVFGETPKLGDVVVFRWPGNRSQAWVKRVVGLPGDRIQMRQGQLFINYRAASLKADGIGEAEDDNGGVQPARRYVARDLQDPRQWLARQHPGSDGPAGPSVRDGRQPRQLRRQPRPDARRRRRAVADR